MARKTTNLINLPKMISEILDEYSDSVIENINEAIVPVAEETIKTIEDKAPERTGKYKNSWTYKEVKSKKGDSVVIYSKMPQLPHLLEFSHALRNGGRSKAQPHIAPAAAEAETEMEKRIKEAIEDAG